MALGDEHRRAMLNRRTPGKWAELTEYTGHDADVSTANGKNVKDRYRLQIGALLNQHVGNSVLYAGDSEHIDQALPMSSTIKECIALYTALMGINNAIHPATPPTTVSQLLHSIRTNEAISKVVVARETGYGAYFTYSVGDPLVSLRSVVVLRSNEDIVYDMFRTFQCDFSAVGGDVEAVLRGASDANLGYVHLELEHLIDRYRVTKMAQVLLAEGHPVVTVWNSLPDVVRAISLSLEGGEYTETANHGQSASLRASNSTRAGLRHSLVRTAAEEAATVRRALPYNRRHRPHVYVSFGYRFLPTAPPDLYCPDVFNLQAMFDGPADLDLEYRTYCHRRAARPLLESTRFARSMEVQERTGSLAGIIARRYGAYMSAAEFVDNMQETARLNQDPMDMDHTILAMNSLSIRRGTGTYSSYIRVPHRPAEARKVIGDFWPLYPDTWLPLLDPQNGIVGQLVPAGI